MHRALLALITSVLLLIAVAPPVTSQVDSRTAFRIRPGASLPATCNPSVGDVFFKTTASIGLYECTSANTWTFIGEGITGSGANTRVAFWTSDSALSSDADLTFATDTLTMTKGVASTSFTNSALTSGRVIFSGASGIQSDDSDFTFTGGNTVNSPIGVFSTRAAAGLTTNVAGEFYAGISGADSSMFLDSAGTGVSPRLLMRRATGTQASRANVANADILGLIAAQGWSSSYFDTAQINFVVDGAVTDGQRPPVRVDIYTNASNGAQTLATRIDASQNLTQTGVVRANGGFNDNGNAGADATLTCGAGQAVKNITVSGGIVTAVSCGAP